ncbi:hypothetical protein FRC11_007777 [Ceratobasidium sp. 423]|nr:hypothetical protein FRC11_007777 [Ceratobasidium sp. 423]
MSNQVETNQDPGDHIETEPLLAPPNPPGRTSLQQENGWYVGIPASAENEPEVPVAQSQDGNTRPPFIYHVTGRMPAERTVPRYNPYKRVPHGHASPQIGELGLKQLAEAETQAATGSSQQPMANSQGGAASHTPTYFASQPTYMPQQPTYFAAQPINSSHAPVTVPQTTVNQPPPNSLVLPQVVSSVTQQVVAPLPPKRIDTEHLSTAERAPLSQTKTLNGSNKRPCYDQVAMPAEVQVSPTPIIRAQVLNNADNTIHEATKNLAAPRPPVTPSTLDGPNTRLVSPPSHSVPEIAPTVSPIILPSVPSRSSPKATAPLSVVQNIRSPMSINSSLRSLLSSTPDRAPAPTGTPGSLSPQGINPNPLPVISSSPVVTRAASITQRPTNSPRPISTRYSGSIMNQGAEQDLAPPSVTQGTNDNHPGLVEDNKGENSDEEYDEEEMISSVYEDNNDARWHKLYGMIRQMATTQTNLVLDVQRLNMHANDSSKCPEQSGEGGGGTYVSPPEPPKPINWDQSVVCDTPAGRQARARREVFLAGLIRGTLGSMLKRTSNREPLPHPPPASLRAPTNNEFGIRYEENERSPFNQMAANVVAERIIRDQLDLLTAAEKLELRRKVTKHIKYLCRRYKDENCSDAEEFNRRRLKRCSAGSRKRQLYETRLQTLDRFPAALGKHRRLIVHLGVDGTSSDEEDHRSPGIYKIKMKPELSSKVTQLKRNLDFVYNLYFKGPGSKGSQVHRRVPSNLVSNRPFTIEQLPVTCVSRAWFQGLELPEREFFRFQPHKYDYSFPTSLYNFRPTNEEREIVRDASPA